MADAFVVRRNGGGTKLFAAIGVTYPAGSTCTCTNGSKTLKAKTTSGQWVFPIPEAGTWTVTATDGTETASQSVEITSEGQAVSVELSYGLLLYKAGNEYTAITGGWYVAHKDGSPTLTKNSADMTIKIPASASVAIASKSAINLSKYNALKIKFGSLNYKTNGYAYWGTTKTVASFGQDSYSAVSNLSTAANNIVSCNISKISDSQYVKLAMSGYNAGGETATSTILEIRAE